MSDPNENQSTSMDVLEMSDADIESMDLSDFESRIPVEAESGDTGEPAAVEEETADPLAADTESGDSSEGEDEAASSEGEESDSAEEGEGEGEEESASDSDKQLAALFAPFKANGKEMQIDSIDDARQLMQMGANYNKKMAALKPSLKLVKMLDNNELLDEGKLSFLIDLSKKDPKAIAKFIKESGIDPLDLDVNTATEYKPNTYTVDDREVELDSVLQELADSPKYHDTLQIVNNKWDATSKQTIVSNPNILKVINEHVENGIYAQIASQVEKDRMLGRLGGLSDLEAYRQVGDRMYEEGKFGPTPSTAEVKQPVVKPKADPKLSERKRAAAPPKAVPAKKAEVNLNPLSMSDAEFDKAFSTKFL